jgi:hypothetical protein
MLESPLRDPFLEETQASAQQNAAHRSLLISPKPFPPANSLRSHHAATFMLPHSC